LRGLKALPVEFTPETPTVRRNKTAAASVHASGS
jgi:hypothetical protein